MTGTRALVSCASKDNLICTACGTQYDVVLPSSATASTDSTFIPASACPLTSCRVCDDPRQYVPPSGQKFTTLERLWHNSEGFENVFERVDAESGEANVIELWTEPKFGIGQRACILQTPHGNVIWDLVAYLDADTVAKINDLGGLKLIIISHPHFYTTWAEWATTFNCPVYMAQPDALEWLNRPQTLSLRLLTETHTEVLPGLTAIMAGGHFPGSLMLHSAPPNTTIASLFVADTIMSVPSASNPRVEADPHDPSSSSTSLTTKPGKQFKYFHPDSQTVSYTFMWSIPNMVPLSPPAIRKIWNAVKDFDFLATYGVFAKTSVVRERPGDRECGLMGLRERVGQSMRVFLKKGGWGEGEVRGIGVS